MGFREDGGWLGHWHKETRRPKALTEDKRGKGSCTGMSGKCDAFHRKFSKGCRAVGRRESPDIQTIWADYGGALYTEDSPGGPNIPPSYTLSTSRPPTPARLRRDVEKHFLVTIFSAHPDAVLPFVPHLGSRTLSRNVELAMALEEH